MCLLFRTHNFRDLNGSQETFVYNTYENFKLVAVPITVTGNFIGSVVCSGLQFPITSEQREERIRRLTKLGLSGTGKELVATAIHIIIVCAKIRHLSYRIVPQILHSLVIYLNIVFRLVVLYQTLKI